jgi:cytochrome c oxidase subunit 2
MKNRASVKTWGLLSAAAAALFTVTAWAQVEPEPGVGLPRDISAEGFGERIDWLMNITHVFNIILFVIMCVWMAWACVKHNRKHEAEYDHGSSKRSVTIALCLSAFIFAVVDGNLFFNTVIGLDNVFWNFEIPKSNPETVRIQINGHQWAWDARYAGTDKQFGTEDDIVTWNDLKIPAGVPVYLQLGSTDVIHSFYLPNFRVKMDAVPGQLNRTWFHSKPDARGSYDIGCAQHCGTHHYKMKGMLTVLSPDDYKAWEGEASINAKRAFDPDDKTAHWAWEWKEI